MIKLPVSWIQWLVKVGFVAPPDFLAIDVAEAPDRMPKGVAFREVRQGYEKWLHLECPRCGEHIQIPLAGKGCWSVSVDWLRRPTVNPSIWQTGSCQAHFFVRRGAIEWCPDGRDSSGGRRGTYA